MRRTARTAVVGGLIGAVLLIASPAGGESQSASYVLKQSASVAGAGLGTEGISDSFRLQGSAGQESVVGASGSPHFVLQSGFWAFGGSALGPVLLTVNHGSLPGNVDLLWTGENEPYTVYQSIDCAGVFASPLVVTPLHSYLEATPPPGDLVCFNILATAPGP
jgi:hypothetical protein